MSTISQPTKPRMSFAPRHSRSGRNPVRKITSARANNSEAGMVSIMVTMILMIVLSLIVLGFAQVARRNQRQVLDRQLSTQAFYAAETGVNDVANLIKTAVVPVPDKTDCTNGSTLAETTFYASLLASSNVDSANNVAYTCVMVSPAPTSIEKSITSSGSVLPLIASSNTFSRLDFTWQTADASNPIPAVGCPGSITRAFSSTSAWSASKCGYGVLRFDLVPTSGPLTQGGLQANTMSTFVVPINGGGVTTIPFSASGSQDIVGAKCTNTGCTLSITGLSAAQYDLRILSLYNPVGLTIKAIDNTGGAVNFQGVQAVIDATGKAQDVLRRIQVRMPLTASNANLTSDFALQTTDSICKRFAIMDSYFSSTANAVVSGMESASPSNPTNPLCNN